MCVVISSLLVLHGDLRAAALLDEIPRLGRRVASQHMSLAPAKHDHAHLRG